MIDFTKALEKKNQAKTEQAIINTSFDLALLSLERVLIHMQEGGEPIQDHLYLTYLWLKDAKGTRV